MAAATGMPPRRNPAPAAAPRAAAPAAAPVAAPAPAAAPAAPAAGAPAPAGGRPPRRATIPVVRPAATPRTAPRRQPAAVNCPPPAVHVSNRSYSHSSGSGGNAVAIVAIVAVVVVLAIFFLPKLMASSSVGTVLVPTTSVAPVVIQREAEPVPVQPASAWSFADVERAPAGNVLTKADCQTGYNGQGFSVREYWDAASQRCK